MGILNLSEKESKEGEELTITRKIVGINELVINSKDSREESLRELLQYKGNALKYSFLSESEVVEFLSLSKADRRD